MQHNSTHEITLYKVKIFWSVGKFLKNLSQFDLQLHRSKIPAGTAGGTKNGQLDASLIVRPSGTTLLQREKKKTGNALMKETDLLHSELAQPMRFSIPFKALLQRQEPSIQHFLRQRRLRKETPWYSDSAHAARALIILASTGSDASSFLLAGADTPPLACGDPTRARCVTWT